MILGLPYSKTCKHLNSMELNQTLTPLKLSALDVALEKQKTDEGTSTSTAWDRFTLENYGVSGDELSASALIDHNDHFFEKLRRGESVNRARIKGAGTRDDRNLGLFKLA